MIFYIEATDSVGLPTRIATEDPAEALQSKRAFEAARFNCVEVHNQAGETLLESDILKLVEQQDGFAH